MSSVGTGRREKRLRKYVSLREKLAAALSMLLPQAQRDELREARAPAKMVISLFSPDHNILHALGGPDKWWNLTWMLREPHREKSRRDTAIVAKSARLAKAHEAFRRRVLAIDKALREPSSRWPQGRKVWPRHNFRRNARKSANRDCS